MRQFERVIVGGGLAGLTAGVLSHGSIAIIEKSSIGGRTNSEIINGVPVDTAAIYLMSLDDDVLQLFKKIGILPRLKKVNKKMLFCSKSKHFLFDFTKKPVIPADFFSSHKEYLQFLSFITIINEISENDFDIKSHLSRYTIEHFVNPVVETFYLGPAESIPNFAKFRLLKKFFDPTTDFFIIQGGFIELVKALSSCYKGELLTDRVLSIKKEKGSFLIKTTSGSINSKEVISAIPFPEFKKLFSTPLVVNYFPARVLIIKATSSPMKFDGIHMVFFSDDKSPVRFLSDNAARLGKKQPTQLVYVLISPDFIDWDSQDCLKFIEEKIGGKFVIVKDYLWKDGFPKIDSSFIKFAKKREVSGINFCGDSVGLGIRQVIESAKQASSN